MTRTLTRPCGVLLAACGVLPAFVSVGCELLPIFESGATSCCDEPGERRRVSCGVCGLGSQTLVCGDDHVWQELTGCVDNEYDRDGDGYPNQVCFDREGYQGCCGPRASLDCDDGERRRYPGHGDLDGDEHIDHRCMTAEQDFEDGDCDDDDPRVYNNSADLDGDGHIDVRCCQPGTASCDDCDDSDPDRWNGHADLDLDGHTDARCCAEDTPMCDDCDDDDPLRWGNHADLDGDGHDAVSCGGDDCDDSHPQRWLGHADVDGDGHIDRRCCDGQVGACDDCNDDDPLRWSGNADLDGDGYRHAMCGGGDCDDECATCFPGADMVFGDGLDHQCDGVIDDRQRQACEMGDLEVVGELDTGDSLSVAVVGRLAYVGSTTGLHEVDVSEPAAPLELRHSAVGSVRDLAVVGDLVYCASSSGLIIVDRAQGAELTTRSALVGVGDARGVEVRSNIAHVASHGALHVVDASNPDAPVILYAIGPDEREWGEPAETYSFWDVQDVALVADTIIDTLLYDVIVTTRAPSSGVRRLTFHHNAPSEADDVPEQLLYFQGDGVGLEGPTALFASPDVLFIGSEQEILVSRTDELHQVDRVAHAGTRGLFSVMTASRRLLFASSDGGLSVFEDASHTGLRPVSSHVPALGPTRGIVVENDLLFAVTDAGLRVLSLGCEP